MSHYIARSAWYALVIAGILALTNLSATEFTGSYLSAASIYLPLSLFFWVSSLLLIKSNRFKNETVAGISTKAIAYGVIATGFALGAVGAFTETNLMWQFTFICVFAGVDTLLLLREAKELQQPRV